MNEIVIKPCTHKQLAKEMGVSTFVLKTWLRPLQNKIGKRKGRYYNLEQMLIIIKEIGHPSVPPIFMKEEE